MDGRIYTLKLLPAEPSDESHFHRIGHAFILLYAINDRASFQHIQHQYNKLKQAKGANLNSTPLFLVGTKLDLQSERQVLLQEARQLAVELRCQKLFEISVRDQSAEIDDLFSKLVRQHQTFEQGFMASRPPMTPTHSTTASMSSPQSDSPARRGSVLDRLRLGSLKRKNSVQTLVRKKSSSFSESIISLTSARPSRENVRSSPYSQSNTQGEGVSSSNGNSPGNGYVRTYSNSTTPRKSITSSPYRLDVNTSAWRDTVKWPTEIILEEELSVK